MKKYIIISILIVAVIALSVGCGSDSAVSSTPPPTESANPSLEEPLNTTSETEEEYPAEYNADALNEYMASVIAQADLIRTSLEQDPLNQYEMNSKSQELFELWDEALNYLWDEIKNSLPEDEFSKLLDEQLLWIADKDKAVEEAGKDFEGGSMHALTVNMEAADITEARVYELSEVLLNR